MRNLRNVAWLLVALAVGSQGCVDPGPDTAHASVAARARDEWHGGAGARDPATRLDVSFFYDQLDPYGRWVDYPPYGWCWVPDVPGDWRPYSDGSWIYSDAGWAWDADEPWGWAVFHYGSWFDDPYYGWVWVPGTVWSPAWVVWRYDEDDIGWAPLPPGVTWSATFGLSFGDVGFIPARRWCFVERDHLLDRGLRGHLLPEGRNPELLARTHLRVDYGTRDGRPFDRGLDVLTVERRLGRSVPRVHLADAADPRRGLGLDAGRGTLAVFRPEMRRAPLGSEPHHGLTRRNEGGPLRADAQRSPQAGRPATEAGRNGSWQRPRQAPEAAPVRHEPDRGPAMSRGSSASRRVTAPRQDRGAGGSWGRGGAPHQAQGGAGSQGWGRAPQQARGMPPSPRWGGGAPRQLPRGAGSRRWGHTPQQVPGAERGAPQGQAAERRKGEGDHRRRGR
jgi:hypothetical protein